MNEENNTRQLIVINNTNRELFVTLNEQFFKIVIHTPNYPEMKNLKINASWGLKQLLNSSQTSLPPHEGFHSLEAYMEELNKFFDALEDRNRAEKPSTWNYLQNYNALLDELKTTKGKIKSFTKEDVVIEIQETDCNARCLTATLQIPSTYPQDLGKVIHSDLPIDTETYTTITSYYRQFCANINELNEFWNSMELLDANCWILEPISPKYSDRKRRIALSSDLSIMVTFDPFKMSHIPEIQFFGATNSVNKYRGFLEKNLQEGLWDSDSDILMNLESILGLSEFPKKPSDSVNADESVLCAICYEVRLNNEMPSIMCENIHCRCQYHKECLLEWLQSVGTNMTSFGEIHGECTNCSEMVSCPIPAAMN